VISDQEIIVVSGLPRSGTSLMMQMLHRGGIPVMTDERRTADIDNPAGYFEFEAVKNLREDSSWIPSARGKAVKMISMLLYDLPVGEHYRILFMERNPEEVIQSQEKMLRRLNQPVAPREEMLEAFRLHLSRLAAVIAARNDVTLLRVPYRKLVESPQEGVERISSFLGGVPDVTAMVEAVNPELYRNRSEPAR
jgi:hypothetical protein